MKMFKRGLITLFILSLVGIAKPANANPITDFLNSITNEINKIIGIFDNVSDEIEDAGADAEIVIHNVKGELGLPDLELVEQSIYTELEQDNRLADAPFVQTRIEVEAIKSNANSVLGTTGQELSIQQLRNVENSVETIAALENQATQAQTSQEVLKAIASQQSQQAVINSNLNQSLQDLKQSNAFSNLADATIIEQNQVAARDKQLADLQLINDELAIVEILKDNLYPAKPCPPGTRASFTETAGGYHEKTCS